MVRIPQQARAFLASREDSGLPGTIYTQEFMLIHSKSLFLLGGNTWKHDETSSSDPCYLVLSGWWLWLLHACLILPKFLQLLGVSIFRMWKPTLGADHLFRTCPIHWLIDG